jgi:hypothetical protein
MPTSGTRLDEDHEDDGRGDNLPWHDRRLNINAWGMPIDDLHFCGEHQRTRSPSGDGGRRHADADDCGTREHGCQISHSPMCHRVRQPQRWDDVGWDRH